jgi:arsenite methyltransferase
MGRLEFDERVAQQLEVLYHTRDLLRRRRLVRDALQAAPGDRILDVGCGPGFYTAELLDEVGPDGSLVGVDASAQMLAVAERRCQGKGDVTFHQGDARSLPVGDAEFDRTLCVQVLEYVDDPSVVLAEMFRALKPGGRAVVWDVDWSTVSWHSSDPARMELVLRAWDEHLAHPAVPRTLTGQLRAAGFEDARMEGHTFATNSFSGESYGGATVPVIERYVADPSRLGEEEASAWVAEQQELDERGEFFFACIQFGFTARRPGT